MYNKLFTKILDSSIWLAPDPHRLVWITLVAAMDEDSIAHFACPENLAARARVSLEDTESALEAFLAPDPHGGEQEYEGRRIERVPGGWLLLNGSKYRNAVTRSIMLQQNRERVRRYRERHNPGNVTVMHHKQDHNHNQKQEQTKKLKATRRAEPPDWYVEFKSVFPRRAGDPDWAGGLRCAHARIAEGHDPKDFVSGARRYRDYILATKREGSDYIQQASRFLGRDKPFMLPWNPPTEAETATEEIQRLNGGHNAPTERVFEAESGRTGLVPLFGNVRR